MATPKTLEERKKEQLIFEGTDYQNAADKMNSYFLSQMWMMDFLSYLDQGAR